MRRVVLSAVVFLLALPVAAQQGRPTPERLRQQITERFMTMYRQQAGLTEEEFGRFESVARASWEARTQEDQRRRELFQALEGQMLPGVAADPAVVGRTLDGLMALERQRAERAQTDMDAYAQFLSPVQRAQLLIMMTRFERQVDQIMQQRMERMNPREMPGGAPLPRRNDRPRL